MRALVTATGGTLELAELEAPVPGPGEVLVRLRLCGLCGTDLYKLDHGLTSAGAVLGHEVVGEIESVGEGASLPPGARCVVPHHTACGDCEHCRRGAETSCATFRINQIDPGGFAELFVVRAPAVASALRLVPRRIDDRTALFTEPLACVLRSLAQGGLPGDTIGRAAILGAGSMGLLHLLAIRAVQPAVEVIVIEPLARRRTLAQQLGADEVSHHAPVASTDVVFDTSGSPDAIASGLELLRPRGTLVLFAHAGSSVSIPLPADRVLRDELRLLGAYSSGRLEQDHAFRLLVSERLDPRPLLTEIVPFSRFEQAIESVRSRRQLKVAFAPEAPS